MAKKPKFTQGDDNVNLGKGDDVANAKGGNDSVAGGSGDDRINGGLGNDFLRGGTGDDTLNGGEGDDRLAGGTGDDTLNGGAGVNVVDGGEGDDLVVLDGNFKDAKVTADGTGFKIVTALGTTTVTNVENFQFADGVVGVDQILGTSAGKTFVLTIPIDNVVGTAGDDTILGDSATLTADQIAGGDGKDVLRIASTTAASNYVPTMSGVERWEITTTGANTNALNLSNTTGLAAIANNGGSGNFDVSAAKAIVGLELSNQTAGAYTIGYDAAAVVGIADKQTLTLNNSTTTSLTVQGIEALEVKSDGTSNKVTTLTDAALKTVSVSGAGAFTVATAAAITSYDASTSTGKQSATFSGVSDVVAKGGTADDTFAFGATFTGKDTVDGGAGKDTVSLVAGDYTLATNETLKALNTLTNVEGLAFTGAVAASIDRNTLTSATLNTFTFDNGAGAINIANGRTGDSYIVGDSHTTAGNVTFTGGVPAPLNLTLAGVTAGATGVPAYADADIGDLNTAAASNVTITSTGLSAVASGIGSSSGGYGATFISVNDVNQIGAVTNAVNATFTIKGDAHTAITSFSAAVIADATGLTGDLYLKASGGADVLKGGAGSNELYGLAGVDGIDISLSSAKVDWIHLDDIKTAADRDVVTGFKAGVGGDVIVIENNETTGSAATGTAIFQTTAAIATLNATSDVFEFTGNLVGTSLGDGSTNSLDGTNLFAAINGGADLTVGAGNQTGYIIAYQNSNAYIYYYAENDNDSAAGGLEANEVFLVAEVKGVALGALEPGNFDIVA